MKNIKKGHIFAGRTLSSKLGYICLKCTKDKLLSNNACYFFARTEITIKPSSGSTHKNIKKEKTKCMQREANQDQNSESAGQASGGSQLDWCTTVAACIIQTSPIVSFPFLQPCKRAQTQHMGTRKVGRRKNGRWVSNEDVQAKKKEKNWKEEEWGMKF